MIKESGLTCEKVRERLLEAVNEVPEDITGFCIGAMREGMSYSLMYYNLDGKELAYLGAKITRDALGDN